MAAVATDGPAAGHVLMKTGTVVVPKMAPASLENVKYAEDGDLSEQSADLFAENSVFA